jgi:GAF domain-containing protein
MEPELLSPVTVMSLEQLLAQAVAVVGAECGDLQLLDKAGGLVIVAAKNLPAEFVTLFKRVPADGPSVCAKALRERRPVIVADVESDPACAGCKDVLLAHGVRSVRSTPLVGEDGDVLGVLSTHRRVPAPKGDWEMDLLRVQGREAGRRVEWLLRG